MHKVCDGMECDSHALIYLPSTRLHEMCGGGMGDRAHPLNPLGGGHGNVLK